MSYYPAWFDFAKWILGICGFLCLFAIRSQPAGQLRGRLKLIGLLSMATAALFGGSAGLLFNSRAAVSATAGVLSEVAKHGGRGAHTDFNLTQPDGKVLLFTVSSEVEAIVDGEDTRIRYQDGSDKVLQLYVVSGRYQGVVYARSNGLLGSYAVLAIAIPLLLYAFWDFRHDGLATTQDSALNLNSGPGGDVDEQSMLKL